ncbi:MAG: 30S ribosomal protein S8 [Phycisphaerales bacterium]
MSQQDLTSDMLTRVRNANRNHAPSVKCLNNKLNRGVAQVLKDEGYISDFDVIDDGRQGVLTVNLKYGDRGEKVITGIKRVSKPGCRVYRGSGDLPRPLAGLGIVIVSTSRGVLSDRKCRELGVGGEIVAEIT